jgi:hypothetical protein
MIRGYRDLEVRQIAMDLAKSCHMETKQYPKDEMFGLISQTLIARIERIGDSVFILYWRNPCSFVSSVFSVPLRICG